MLADCWNVTTICNRKSRRNWVKNLIIYLVISRKELIKIMYILAFLDPSGINLLNLCEIEFY